MYGGSSNSFSKWKQQMWLKNGILPFCLFTWGILLIVVAWTISTTIWYLILKTVRNKGEEREEEKKHGINFLQCVLHTAHLRINKNQNISTSSSPGNRIIFQYTCSIPKEQCAHGIGKTDDLETKRKHSTNNNTALFSQVMALHRQVI